MGQPLRRQPRGGVLAVATGLAVVVAVARCGGAGRGATSATAALFSRAPPLSTATATTSASKCAAIRSSRGLLANASLPARVALKAAVDVDANETRDEEEARTKMPLSQRISWSLAAPCSTPSGSMTYAVAARYAPVNGTSSLAPLYAATETRFATCGDGGAVLDGELRLLRLRTNARYDVELLVYDVGTGGVSREYASTFTTASTGYAAFDDGPFVAVSGAAPSWDVLTLAAQQDTLGFGEDAPANGAGKAFDGMLAVDGEGHVVWFYHLAGFEAWDFLPGGRVVLASRRQGGETTAARRHGANGTNANSQLQEVEAATGALMNQYVSSCAGAPLGYNALSHECRVDAPRARSTPSASPSSSLDVLSTRYAGRRYPNVSVGYRSTNGTAAVKTDAFLGTQIVTWDRSANKVRVLYDLFDLAAPEPDGKTFSSSNWNAVKGGCSGNTTLEGLEYHHVSSVTVGTASNILVASRTLNTIWSLAHDGSGARWTLSSSLEEGATRGSDAGGTWYSFARPADAFYDPHSALQLPNGDVLVVDDGDDRPGCAADRRGECFSRVICYALDAGTRIARVRWQFEWPFSLSGANATIDARDLYSSVGGSVAPLPNGNYLVAFTSVDDESTFDERGAAFAFEVDAEGGATAVSRLAVPTPIADQDKQGSYRLVPWANLGGETASCPFDTDT